MRKIELPDASSVGLALRVLVGALTGPYTAAFVVLGLCLGASGVLSDGPDVREVPPGPRLVMLPDGTMTEADGGADDEPCVPDAGASPEQHPACHTPGH